MQPGTLILVPITLEAAPGEDQTVKLRPALVIAQENSSLIIVPLTSKKQEPSIQITSDDLSEGRLPVSSFICYDKKRAISKDLVSKVVGQLKPEALESVVYK